MLQGINIFQFYNSIEQRRWNNADIREYTAIFRTGQFPAFCIVTNDIGTVATFEFINAETNEVINNGNINVIESGDSKILCYTGSAGGLGLFPCGYYYYEINFNGNTYYSEVFACTNDFSKLILIKVESANLQLSGIHELPVSSFTELSVYLFYNGITISSEITEEGVEKPYGNIPVFNTLNIRRTAEVNGTAEIFRFLSALRIFSKNGMVTITERGVEKQIYDITTDVKDDNNFGDTVIINFSYKEYDFLSSRNEI